MAALADQVIEILICRSIHTLKLTIGRKIWGFCIFVFLLVGLADLCVYWQMSDAMTWQKMILAVKWPASQAFSDAFASMNMMHSDVRDAIIDHQDAAVFDRDVEQYRQNDLVLRSCVEQLVEMSKGFQKEENKERVRAIAASLPPIEEAQARAFNLAKSGDLKGAAEAIHSVASQGQTLRTKMGELQQQNNTLTHKIFQDIQSDMRTTILWLVCCFAAVLLAGSAISWNLAREVSTHAAFLCRRAQEIADGELTGEPLVSTSRDEFAELTLSMNRMQQHLQEVIIKISAAAEELTGASERITEGSTRSAESSKQQTDQTNIVATAIHEMAVTVQEVSENSRNAATAAEKASNTAREGGTLVRNTLEAMNRIAESNQKISQRVTKLGESSKQVGKIASVIDDIADQTNLLALNAAIEAARAGEQGRGFAVVADEVRKLAERTTAATKEIAGILEVILVESQNTAQAMTAGHQDVEAGVSGSRQAGEALEQIICMASNVGDMVAQIATAATEQASTTDEIQSSAQRIAGMATDSCAATEKSTEACVQLSNLSLHLQDIVRHFKVQNRAIAVNGFVPGASSRPAVTVRTQ
jgi:methyl-accepting chemotaxis protein